ncbi:MAG: phosphatase PAP2 family protein [Actinobacteria bacterium]|nr:phosphatase PAP2 family protein [Actinomycetota bacterium]
MNQLSLTALRRRVEELAPHDFWQPLDRAELPLLKAVERVRLGGPVERAATVITKAGEHGAIWYATAGVASLVDRKRSLRWRQAGTVVLAAYGVSTAVKLAARRRRPPVAAIGTETGLSFPSSHTVTSVAAARMFSYLLPAPARSAVWAIAAAFPASRLHFCVHYPSDIAAGAVLGDALGRATVRRWRRADSLVSRPASPAQPDAPR